MIYAPYEVGDENDPLSPYFGTGGTFSNTGIRNVPTPNVTANAGGITVNTTLLDKILAGVLSGMALVKNAPYVPTTVQPQQGLSGNDLGAILALQGGLGNQQASGGTALGKVEVWLKQNTGVALMGGAAVVLYLMKPPAKSR